jgi:hypothetical protein
MNRFRLSSLAGGALLLLATTSAPAATLVDCVFNGSGGNFVSRGFYIESYPGTSLQTVSLGHAANSTGERTITLTARSNAYNGAFLGVASVTRVITPTSSKSVFDFGNIPISAGTRVTFTQAVIAGTPDDVYYDTGAEPCDANMTEDTAPPLSSPLLSRVGVHITGNQSSISSAINTYCPFDLSSSGDNIDRGFYVTNYRGTTISNVTLYHLASAAGNRSITLVARRGSYDGPIIGTAGVTRNITTSNSATVFDFGNAPVPAGSTIAFEQILAGGDGNVRYNVGYGPCADVTETEGTSPPLDTFRRQSAGVRITGRIASSSFIWVVEYHHTVFDHYFMTGDPDEIAGLDGGAYGGVFVRTGEQFLMRDGPVSGTTDVCRFFTTPGNFGTKSSHFYTADADECAGVKLNPNWIYEKIAFFTYMPTAGDCGPAGIEVYRMYNNGMTGAPNHRFTTSLAIYNDFTTNRGWAPEGVRFCALPLL